jgi:hypothetical protein
MSGEQQNIAAEALAASVGTIPVITDSNFSVTTNNGIVVKCNPSDKKYKVYVVVSKVDSKLYVGYTAITLEKRSFYRRNNIRKKIKRNEKLGTLETAIVALGSDNFLMFELCGFDNKDDALECEKRLIKEYKSHLTVGGYNGSSGGEGGLSGATIEERERESNDATFEIIKWTLEHDGVTPDSNSTDPVERRLGEKLHNLRTACNNSDKSTHTWFDSNKDLAVKNGLYWLFFTPEELANDDMHEIINWMLEHDGVPPSHGSNDPVERKLGIKLRDFRTARNNSKSKMKIYNVEQIAIDRGFPHLLYSPEEHRNVRIREFAHFVKENNRTPKRRIEKEKELYNWWGHTKKGIKKKSANLWTAANKKLAEELGVAHYFKVG